ncbi:MAG: hypothetical protein Q9215_005862 [Flavoplaca cf. flavocitrina]
MTSQTDNRLVPDWSTGLTPDDIANLLKHPHIQALPPVLFRNLHLLLKPIKYLANKITAQCFQWLETELRVLRLSWCDLQRLSSERSRPIHTTSLDFDAAAIKSFQKGVREATDKAGRAVEDLQHLEDWAKKVHYEIITYQES